MTRIAVLCVAAVVAGCVHTNVTELGAIEYEPTNPERVVIYRTAGQVGRAYAEIGLINAAGDSGWTSEGKMSRAMKKQAAKIGAHAIILGGFTEPTAGAKIAGAIFGVSAQRKGAAVAIRFKQLSASEAGAYALTKETSRSTSGSW